MNLPDQLVPIDEAHNLAALRNLCRAPTTEVLAARLLDVVLAMTPAMYCGLVAVGSEGKAAAGPGRARDPALGDAFRAVLVQVAPAVARYADNVGKVNAPWVAGPTALYPLVRGEGVLAILLLHAGDRDFTTDELDVLPAVCAVAELALERFRSPRPTPFGGALLTRIRNPLGYLQTHLRLAQEELESCTSADERLRSAVGSLGYASEAARRLEAIVIDHTRATRDGGA